MVHQVPEHRRRYSLIRQRLGRGYLYLILKNAW